MPLLLKSEENVLWRKFWQKKERGAWWTMMAGEIMMKPEKLNKVQLSKITWIFPAVCAMYQ